MPRPLNENDPNARAAFKVQADDLTNDSQYNHVVSWVAARLICVFGMQRFLVSAVVEIGHSFRRGGDRRKKCWKDLDAAQERLLQAAFEYDEALQAVRADLGKGVRR